MLWILFCSGVAIFLRMDVMLPFNGFARQGFDPVFGFFGHLGRSIGANASRHPVGCQPGSTDE